jgi:hypothetical protein
LPILSTFPPRRSHPNHGLVWCAESHVRVVAISYS